LIFYKKIKLIKFIKVKLSKAHVHLDIGEMTARQHVRQIVVIIAMKQQGYAVIADLAIGMNTVIKSARKIVALYHAVKVMVVVIRVPMAGMVKRATTPVISIVINVIKRLGHAQYVMIINGENSVTTRVFQIAKYVTN
jgi:phage terminase large subunit-like protein